MVNLINHKTMVKHYTSNILTSTGPGFFQFPENTEIRTQEVSSQIHYTG